jgi:hypothetical protein
METQYVHNVQNVSDVDLANFDIAEAAVEEAQADEDEWYCELDEIDAQIFGNKFVRVQGLNESLLQDDAIISGEYTLMAPNAWIADGEMVIPSDGQESEAMIEPLGREEGSGRRLKSGTKTVLVVRVEGSDTATTADEQKLYDEVFLGNSLTKMYKDCSHGEFNLIPYEGSGVQNGVTTVKISNQVTGSANPTIRNAAVAALNQKLGGAADKFVDFVLMCIPPGTSGGW